MLSYTPFRDLKIIRLIKSIIRFVKRYRFKLSLKKLSYKISYYKNLSTTPLTYSLIQYEKYADELIDSIAYCTDEQKIFSIIQCMQNHNDMVALNSKFEIKVIESEGGFILFEPYPDLINKLRIELDSDTMLKLVSVIKAKINS